MAIVKAPLLIITIEIAPLFHCIVLRHKQIRWMVRDLLAVEGELN